jgi:hypothetical protein
MLSLVHGWNENDSYDPIMSWYLPNVLLAWPVLLLLGTQSQLSSATVIAVFQLQNQPDNGEFHRHLQIETVWPFII